MKQFFVFFFIIGLVVNSFAQTEFNSKFKAIPPLKVKPKLKKEILNPPVALPKIVAPDILKNTNIFNTKPKVDNSFEIGTPENNFSMTPATHTTSRLHVECSRTARERSRRGGNTLGAKQ